MVSEHDLGLELEKLNILSADIPWSHSKYNSGINLQLLHKKGNYLKTQKLYKNPKIKLKLLTKLTPWLMEPGGSMPHSQRLYYNP